ncbi:ABC-type transport auxiliary lipoprotein family protein [Octadecabacter sp. G9-8]|uniref:ABC-type transport auxiliary lipoprotein family protein n=1 Tax=Octadecabacter dasysiphoniae TaxID=2909341 RepID=A0ABS9CY24_9RHOB|nr:ABC-type transport auxiliary lipoprotein family protein [Octadecabacter dasysiphoniae]MCF2872074.1 ABC-type transport auxiliary lipoprotein family protein [Octadecabacter dasysiphoniae]
MIRAATQKLAVAITVLSVLGGCSAIGALGDATTPLSVFDLRAPANAPVARGGAAPVDITVELPTTSGVLDTDRIMIRPDALQAQYLPNVRWGDEVPVMMQTLMLRALENTNGARYVGRRPLAGSGDYAIVTELVDFQAEVGADGITTRVSIRMTSRLVRERDASIVSSRTFTAQEDAGSTETPAVIDAFDRASDAVLLDFADWTMSAIGRRLSPA